MGAVSGGKQYASTDVSFSLISIIAKHDLLRAANAGNLS